MSNVITKTGKEVSTGTSVTGLIEAWVHGPHGPTIAVIVSGILFIAILTIIEIRYETKKHRKCPVRNYGLIRVH